MVQSQKSPDQLLQGVPDLKMHPLRHVMEVMRLQQLPGTLWLEFGVASGRSINYIAAHAQHMVHGFDSFQGLPEMWREGFDKGHFDMQGVLPQVAANVALVPGWFEETLAPFLAEHSDKQVSFLHIDCDLYSSTKLILDTLTDRLAPGCVVVFDELVNYPGFDGPTGELRAFAEWRAERGVSFSWIGMNGMPFGMAGYEHENVALVVHGVGHC